MVSPTMLDLSATFTLFAASVVNAADQQNFRDFILGGPFEAAQQCALEKEWKLAPLSDNLPGKSKVEEANLPLFVCNGVVASVTEPLDGDLREFAGRAFLRCSSNFGEPHIHILSLACGIETMSTINSGFDVDDGGATFQLQSIGGKRTLSISHRVEVDFN